MLAKLPWLPVVLLVIYLHLVSGWSTREAEAESMDGILSKANEKLAKRFAGRSLGKDQIHDGTDMLLSRKQYQRLYSGVQGRNEGRLVGTPWTNGDIPFEIDDRSFSNRQKDWILRAMKKWEGITCVRFRPATSSDKNKVKIITGPGCLSNVGMMDAEQPMFLSPLCFLNRVVEHELGHTIGLIHEHQRPQRDGHIRVNYYNVEPNQIQNFFKYARGSDDKLGLPYDYTSIMHYAKTAFGKHSGSQKMQTVHTRDPTKQDIIGMGYEISFLDAKLVNLMYDCRASCSSPPTCKDDCFVTADCRCICKQDMPKEHCEDKRAECPDQAKKGVCSVNPILILTRCRKSCGVCKDDGTEPEVPCLDAEDDCQDRASRGECDSNVHYMYTHCRRACEDCPEHYSECRDINSTCQDLARKGECNRNPGWMLRKCRKSCDFCVQDVGKDPTTESGCVDYDTVCQWRADNGKCSEFPECRQACGKC